jgi:hypothetical protein
VDTVDLSLLPKRLVVVQLMMLVLKKFDDHIGSWHMFDYRSHALDLKAL